VMRVGVMMPIEVAAACQTEALVES
jgi:hypothetical protein